MHTIRVVSGYTYMGDMSKELVTLSEGESEQFLRFRHCHYIKDVDVGFAFVLHQCEQRQKNYFNWLIANTKKP